MEMTSTEQATSGRLQTVQRLCHVNAQTMPEVVGLLAEANTGRLWRGLEGNPTVVEALEGQEAPLQANTDFAATLIPAIRHMICGLWNGSHR